MRTILEWAMTGFSVALVCTFVAFGMLVHYTTVALLWKRKPGVTLRQLTKTGLIRENFRPEAARLLRMRRLAIVGFLVSFAVVAVYSLSYGAIHGWSH